jgi:DNA invertase Pin-like site-specific DNA recombinase
MKIIAYTYSDHLLESPPNSTIWGWEIAQIYQDFGKRIELDQLIIDCQNEPTQYLLIRRLEELGDSLAEISDRIIQIEASKVQIITTEQSYNSSQTPDINLLKLIGEIQTQTNRRRLRQGHARNRHRASPPPGKAPLGYRRGKDRYILDRSTAPVVKDFFEQFLLYGSLRSAVRYLEKKYGKKISVSTGRRWLTNAIYRGDTAYHTGEVISDTHSPILNREEAAQIDRLLRRNRQLPPRTASAPRSLAGLVVCSECQSHMTVTSVTKRRQDQKYLYLRPINCPKLPKCRAITYETILNCTILQICQELPRAVEAMNAPNLDGVKQNYTAEIANKQEILQQLPALIASGILDTETAELRAYKLQTEISQLRSRLDALPPVNLKAIAQAVSIPQFWNDLSESERRFYFREFIRAIKLTRHEKTWELQLIFIF